MYKKAGETMKILLNAGHGAGIGHNRGGICFNEGDNNFYYSLVLKEELGQYKNVKVDLVRNKISDNPSLAERSAMGKGYDLFLSIHSNAAELSVRGTEVWDSVEKPNFALAKAICDNTAKLFNHNNRGVKYKEGQTGYNWYAELRFNEAKSAMIVENGFHTNYDDCIFFKNNHRLIAQTQAKLIASHYKLERNVNNMSDKSEFSEWAVEAMQWAMDKNRQLTDGLNSKEPLTLERLITILYRYNSLKK